MYALLGLLAIRPWTGYELATQVGRSLQLVWPASRATLYRDQASLVERGWARARNETTGARQRKRYTITAAGRRALQSWFATEPAPAAFSIEAIVRAWLVDQAASGDVARALHSTANDARQRLSVMAATSRHYLAGEGDFPARAHANAIAADLLSDLLSTLARRCDEIAAELNNMKGAATDPEAVSRRFERVIGRAEQSSPRPP